MKGVFFSKDAITITKVSHKQEKTSVLSLVGEELLTFSLYSLLVLLYDIGEKSPIFSNLQSCSSNIVFCFRSG